MTTANVRVDGSPRGKPSVARSCEKSPASAAQGRQESVMSSKVTKLEPPGKPIDQEREHCWYLLMQRYYAARADVAYRNVESEPFEEVYAASDRLSAVLREMVQTREPRPDEIRQKIAALRDMVANELPSDRLDLLLLASIDRDLHAL